MRPFRPSLLFREVWFDTEQLGATFDVTVLSCTASFTIVYDTPFFAVSCGEPGAWQGGQSLTKRMGSLAFPVLSFTLFFVTDGWILVGVSSHNCF